MARGADTITVLRELGPDNRRVLAAFCLSESRRAGRSGPARRLLRTLSISCAGLDPIPRIDVLAHDLAELELRLARLAPSGRSALRTAADNWLLDGSPMHLLSLATILNPPGGRDTSEAGRPLTAHTPLAD